MSAPLPKTLIVTSDLPPRLGGAARYHGAVARALGSEGLVLVPPEGRHWLSLVPELQRATRQGITFVLTGEVLPHGTAARIARVFGGPPYGVIVHGLDLALARQHPRKRAVARWVLRGAQVVIANSQATAALARAAGAPPGRVRVVYPPIGVTPSLASADAPERIRTAHGLTGKPIVLSVGRLIARKGFDTLIRAVALSGRAVTLVIVGDGPERASLTALAASLQASVVLTGAVDDRALAAWYAAADVVAMLPRALPDGDVEGFGIVYVEAGAFGKPVIGTQSGGVPEAVRDGETGLLVPPDAPEAAAEAIVSVLDDEGLARRLGHAGAARAQEFTPDRFALALRAALM